MSPLATLRLAIRLAWRDMRGGIGGMRIVLACLALGVAAIGAVGGLQVMIRDGIAQQQRSLLGGDLSIESSDPFPPDLASFLAASGARVSQVVRLRSMLYASQSGDGTGGDRMLVELQAVDGAYPLVDHVTIAPPADLARALRPAADGTPALLADPLVIDRLHLRQGDVVRIGTARFRLAGALAHSPDSAGTIMLAPTILIAAPALDAAGLLQPGALATRALRAVLDGPAAGRAARAAALARAIAVRFPDQGWHVRGVADAAPALDRTIDQVALFIQLIGLAALLLGGLGVAAGVTAWLDGRGRTIAILRCLGASGRLVRLVFGLQIMGLCAIGIAGGMAAALLLPPLAVHALAGLLPVDAAGLVPPLRPALLAGLFGAVVALLVTLLPLMRASAIAPAALFHDQDRRRPLGAAGRRRSLAAMAACAALLGLLALALTADWRFLAGFLAAVALAAALLAAAGTALARAVAALLPRLGTRHGRLRLGLVLFARPGAATGRLVVALGAGLAAMATIILVERTIAAQLQDQLPRNAPSFYFVDIQPADLDRFDALARAQPTVRSIAQLPSMRTRVVAVDGVPAERVAATPQTRWALRGDHGLTLSATPPAGTHLAAGQWWPADYAGPPLLSLDAGLARGWGVHLGTTIRLNVLGRAIDFRVASLRDVAWRSLQLNFAFIASPGLLSHAPHSFIATLATDGRADHDAGVLAALTDALPGITGIRIADVLAQLATLAGRLGGALTAAAALLLASGGLVLAATLSAGWRQRVATAAILRALGADAGQIRAIWLLEFTLLGLTAGAMAAAIGTANAWLIARAVLHMPWHADWPALAGTLAVTLCATTLCGMLVWRHALQSLKKRG
ncbi:FtsX-like permease family protein [Nguyenibacter vanlangensis]|uniref:FtsX-like permease family protein n=2 Tax=Nguyenibacter vanlangensis TaxID=1216886 RepID=A0ABZ3D104_9PROT